MKTINKKLAGFGALCMLFSAFPCQAADSQQNSVEALVEMLKAKGVISASEAETFKTQFGSDSQKSRKTALSPQERAALINDISAEVIKHITSLVENSVQQSLNEHAMDESGKLVLAEDIAADVAQRISPYVEARLENKLSAEQPVDDKLRLELIDDVSYEVAQRVSPFVESRLDKNINDKLKEQELGKADHWANRIAFGGDMRLRYQGDFFDANNNKSFADPSDPTLTLPQTRRHRGRIRVRASAKAKINDQVNAVIKLATGNETDPVSTNDTLGDYQNKDSVVFDQAYAEWKAKKIPVQAWAGRIPNPWYSTDLVWDSDLNFEGIAATYKPKFGQSSQAFVTLGAFQIDEFARTVEDKYLLGAQLGLTSQINEKVQYKLAAAYYDYQNITGQASNSVCQAHTCQSEPQFLQKGNTLFWLDPVGSGPTTIGLAADFNELNLTGELDISFFDPVHVILNADYVQNIGYDSADVIRNVTGNVVNNALGDISETQGYQVGLTVGYPKVTDWGQWKTFLRYKYLEADAVLDAFTDSDFHLGGTHAKGWIFGGEFGLAKNTWLRSRWLSTDEISGPQFSIDTFQVDLNLKY